MTVYVEALSLVNALGEDDAILANLAEGRAPGMEGPLVRTVDGFEAPFGRVTIDLPDTNPPSSRNNRLLRACWNLRKTEFESRLKDFEDERIAVVLGTSTSGSQEFSDWWKARKFGSEMPPFAGEWQEMGDPSRDFASFVGAKGPAYTIATACTSSARAIISAARLLEAGLADAVIAGGADTFADMPLNGFHALGVLAGERTRPLTDHRPGITIGEGAGLMLLTRRPSAVKLSGWGESSDGHHMSSPEPEGRGAEAAVRGALSRAGLTPDDIVYVNLHGTGTGQNDASELAAMNRVFATHWRPDGELPEAFFLEVMAQTIGIWSHVHDELTVVPEGDRKADAGLLLSVRGIRIERCVRRGEGTLVCTMSKMMLDDRLAVFEGTVSCNGEAVASGRLTVFQPLESEIDSLLAV